MIYNGWIELIRGLKDKKFELKEGAVNSDLDEVLSDTKDYIKWSNELLDKCIFNGLNIENVNLVEAEIEKLLLYLYGEDDVEKMHNPKWPNGLLFALERIYECFNLLNHLIDIKFRKEGIELDKEAIRNIKNVGYLARKKYDYNWQITDKKLHTDFEILPQLINVQLEYLKDMKDVQKAIVRLQPKGFKDNISKRLEKIHTYLSNKGFINCNVDVWLYWLGAKELNSPPDKITWLKSNYVLSAICKQMCDDGGKQYISNAFVFNKGGFIRPNKSTKVYSDEINKYMKHALNKI